MFWGYILLNREEVKLEPPEHKYKSFHVSNVVLVKIEPEVEWVDVWVNTTLVDDIVVARLRSHSHESASLNLQFHYSQYASFRLKYLCEHLLIDNIEVHISGFWETTSESDTEVEDVEENIDEEIEDEDHEVTEEHSEDSTSQQDNTDSNSVIDENSWYDDTNSHHPYNYFEEDKKQQDDF